MTQPCIQIQQGLLPDALLPPCSSPWSLRSTEQLVIREPSTAPTSTAALPHVTTAKATSLQWFRGAPRPNLAFAPAYSSDPVSGSLLLQLAGLSHPGRPAVSQSSQEHLCLLPRALLLYKSERSSHTPSVFTGTAPSRCLLSGQPSPTQTGQHQPPAPHPSFPALFFTFSILKPLIFYLFVSASPAECKFHEVRGHGLSWPLLCLASGKMLSNG